MVFFDSDTVSRAWLTPDNLTSYRNNPNMDKKSKVRNIHLYRRRLEFSKSQANESLKLSFKERLLTWSFIARWPKKINAPINVPSESDSEDEKSKKKKNKKKNHRSKTQKTKDVSDYLQESSSEEEVLKNKKEKGKKSQKKFSSQEKLKNKIVKRKKDQGEEDVFELLKKDLQLSQEKKKKEPKKLPEKNSKQTQNEKSKLLECNQKLSLVDNEKQESLRKEKETFGTQTLSKNNSSKTVQEIKVQNKGTEKNLPEKKTDENVKEMNKETILVPKKIVEKNIEKPQPDKKVETESVKPSNSSKLKIVKSTPVLQDSQAKQTVKKSRSLGLSRAKARVVPRKENMSELSDSKSSALNDSKATIFSSDLTFSGTTKSTYISSYKENDSKFSDTASVCSISSSVAPKKRSLGLQKHSKQLTYLDNSDLESVMSEPCIKKQKSKQSNGEGKNIKSSPKRGSKTSIKQEIEDQKSSEDIDLGIIESSQSDDFVPSASVFKKLPKLESPSKELLEDVSKMFTDSDILSKTYTEATENKMEEIIRILGEPTQSYDY